MYSVEICRDADETVQAYMNGCEQRFASLEKAEGYVSTFEDFEQGLLCIKQYVQVKAKPGAKVPGRSD